MNKPAETVSGATVHMLQEGLARCGLIGPPSAWPKGHLWVSFEDLEKLPEVNCIGSLLTLPVDEQPPRTPDRSFTYSPQEREVMLARMHHASKAFYRAATAIGCHPFIEFTGLLNEYIKICERAHANGLDFTEANIHSGKAIPMFEHEASYLGEKLGCIYGLSLLDPENLYPFLRAAGLEETAAGFLIHPEPSELERKRVGQ